MEVIKELDMDSLWDGLINGVNKLGENEDHKVSVVVLFNQGKILTVSRKNNPDDFGLPGGKLEPNESFEDGAIREVKEETGLDIWGLVPVFYRMDDKFFAVCFVAQWKGELDHTLEEGVVKWANFSEIVRGSFGKYNAQLKDCLREKGFLPNGE